MGLLDYAAIWTDAALNDTPAITDIFAFGEGTGFTIVTSNGAFGHLISWNLDLSGAGISDTYDLPSDNLLSSTAQLLPIFVDGAPTFLCFGGAIPGLIQFEINPNGVIEEGGTLQTGFEMLDCAIWVNGETGSYILGAGPGQSELKMWSVNPDGSLTEIDNMIVGPDGVGVDIPDMAYLSVSGQDFVVVLDHASNSISLLELADEGMTRIDRVDAFDGLPISGPTEVEIVTIAGEAFAIVSSSGSNSISVLQIDGGSLSLVDHVIDDLNTRFHGVGVMEVIVFNDRAFIAVSGQDMGLTVFTLLPDGKLLTLATLESQNNAPLEDITALEFVEFDGALSLLVAGEGWTGISAIDVNTGVLAPIKDGNGLSESISGNSRNDLINGAGGNDILNGKNGDDILIDGAGADQLIGGDGADIFVLVADGTTDTISDFEKGVDRIDLSQLGQVYSLDALTFTTISGGVEIDFKGETLKVYSDDGSDLHKSDFTTSTLFDIAHLPIAPLPPQDMNLVGQNGSDLLIGGGGNDHLYGGRGEDQLLGGTGNDLLFGSYTNTAFDHVSAQVVRLYQATLDRAPDIGGHVAWTTLILDGEITGQQAASGFVNSPEFQLVYGETTDEEFITLLYQNVLDRAPDDAGLNGWMANLAGNMTRETVVWHFSESPEFSNSMKTIALGFSAAAYQADWTDDVYRLYRATLGREPDEGGLLGWSENLANGMAFDVVIAGFVSSPEFQAVYGQLNDTEFVELLYLNVLGRTPDQGGLAGRLTNLANGMSREQVVAHFAQSPEFVLNSYEDFVTFMRDLGIEDVLEGQEGDDILFGGAMSDLFVFDTDTGGHDQILDIERWDQVHLLESEYETSDDVLGDLVQVGDHVVLDFGESVLTFLNADLEDFEAEMFVV